MIKKSSANFQKSTFTPDLWKFFGSLHAHQTTVFLYMTIRFFVIYIVAPLVRVQTYYRNMNGSCVIVIVYKQKTFLLHTDHRKKKEFEKEKFQK